MKISNLLWGIFFISIGIILGLNALEITNINIFFNGWWTLFIIIPCFIDLFKDEDITGDIIGLVIGISLLLGCNDLINFELIWKLLVPTILVVTGLSFIFKDNINPDKALCVLRHLTKPFSLFGDNQCHPFSP